MAMSVGTSSHNLQTSLVHLLLGGRLGITTVRLERCSLITMKYFTPVFYFNHFGVGVEGVCGGQRTIRSGLENPEGYLICSAFLIHTDKHPW